MGDHGGGHGGHADLPPLPAMIRPPAGAELADPPAAADENPAAVVEVNLRAAPSQWEYLPGQPVTIWAFNGTIPGPTIQASKGDAVVVHFKNDLPEPTTIHWHGIRVPNDMDGAGRLLQPIPPGGTFDYRFTVGDAGLFWYHPHVRSDVQVEKGLYGAVVVRDPAEPAIGAAVDRLLVLDDVRVDPGTGQTSDATDMRSEMMGREGNLLLVNGKPSNGSLRVAQGARTRLRIVNAANARYFNLRLDGASAIQIGGDGGLLRAPQPVIGLLLVPGERVDVVFDAGAPATLKALPYERARGAGTGEEMELARILLDPSAPTVVPPALPSQLRSIDPLQRPTTEQKLTLSESMAHHGWSFTINGKAFPSVPPVDAVLGTRQLWSVRNDSDMDHPLHVHGFFFQKLGTPEWKDTVNVPAKGALDLVVDFENRPGAAGDWMYHCHILEHAEGGMMGEARVR